MSLTLLFFSVFPVFLLDPPPPPGCLLPCDHGGNGVTVPI